MLMVWGQLVGIGLIFLFDWMVNNDYNHPAGWVATGLTGYLLPSRVTYSLIHLPHSIDSPVR